MQTPIPARHSQPEREFPFSPPAVARAASPAQPPDGSVPPAKHRRKTLFAALALVTVALLTIAGAVQDRGRAGIGLPNGGENAFEFVGRSDQNGPEVRHSGYLTHVFGVPDELLFAHPTLRNETTAHFTFVAATTINARHELGNLIVTAAPGEMTVYFHDAGGADFGTPDSFAESVPIATFAVRYHNVLNVQAPNEGIATATAEFVQLDAQQFKLNGRPVHFGRNGLRGRLAATGQGTRTKVEPSAASFVLGGHAVVAGR
ncbi:MAG: hypothetical protein HYY24_05040 [Verrucomicrobia bacterium]|nr:hypothetical protein [Verrucomicrobiota bacterium]